MTGSEVVMGHPLHHLLLQILETGQAAGGQSAEGRWSPAAEGSTPGGIGDDSKDEQEHGNLAGASWDHEARGWS
jgi:hypothetical protein